MPDPSRPFHQTCCLIALACLLTHPALAKLPETVTHIESITDEDKKPIPLPEESAFEHFKSALSLQKKNDFESAVSEYEAALSEGLGLWQAYFNTGVCYTQLSKYQNAYDNLIEAHTRNPKNFRICKYLSFVSHKLGKAKEARLWWQRFNSL